MKSTAVSSTTMTATTMTATTMTASAFGESVSRDERTAQHQGYREGDRCFAKHIPISLNIIMVFILAVSGTSDIDVGQCRLPARKSAVRVTSGEMRATGVRGLLIYGSGLQVQPLDGDQRRQVAG
jgi:hypothetical protein